MKNSLKTFANLNIVVGVVLLLSPILYLGAGAAGLIETDKAFAANQNRETEIIANDPLIKQNSGLGNLGNLDLDVNVPTEGAVNLGNRIFIPSQGIESWIWESMDAEAGLLQGGVWRMPYFGTPSGNDPVVISGHRWGEETRSWEYRRKHLFLNLVNAKVGDEIIINWNGEDVKYVINETKTGEQVDRYDDLILYTCIDFDSPLRFFVFASKV